MTVVEIVDSHQGFKLVTDSITTRNPRILLWVVSSLPTLCLHGQPYKKRFLQILCKLRVLGDLITLVIEHYSLWSNLDDTHSRKGLRFKSSFPQKDAVPIKLHNNNNFSNFDPYKCWHFKRIKDITRKRLRKAWCMFSALLLL